MHRLIYKKGTTHFYKKSGHLVRTPITLTLQPDQRAYYSVAGGYSSTQWPSHGFILQGTYDNTWQVGYECLQAYLQHSNPLQIWRGVNTAHDPETVWYQGAYSTSSPTFSAGYQSCEAYLQLAAYHFTIPEELQSLELSRVKVKFINGGGIAAYQQAGNASNSSLKGKYNFRNWYLPFCVVQSLGTPQQIAQAPFDASVDILADMTAFRGARDLWGFSGTNSDGGIPTLTVPPNKDYIMGADTLGAMATNKQGWIVPFIDASVVNSRNYEPYYVNPTNGWWACVSVWGLTLEVELD